MAFSYRQSHRRCQQRQQLDANNTRYPLLVLKQVPDGAISSSPALIDHLPAIEQLWTAISRHHELTP